MRSCGNDGERDALQSGRGSMGEADTQAGRRALIQIKRDDEKKEVVISKRDQSRASLSR